MAGLQHLFFRKTAETEKARNKSEIATEHMGQVGHEADLLTQELRKLEASLVVATDRGR